MFTVERKAADICGLTLRRPKITSRLFRHDICMAVQSYMSCCRGQAEEFCLPPLCGAVISLPESKKTQSNVNPQISAAFYSTVCSSHYMHTAFAGLPMQRDQFVGVAQCPTSHEASMMENQHQGMLILNWKGTRGAATGRGKHPRTLP